MIELNDIFKTYLVGDNVVHALRGVSLKIGQGEFVAIMGPSGSGKSTLMHILGLLDIPTSGSYKLNGREVSELEENALAKLRNETIGFVFQQYNLLARTSARDNVRLPLIYSFASDDTVKAEARLREVGLSDRIHHKPNELSGGQQQRVAIARALVNRPGIIFADEPTGNLDSSSEREIMDIFTKLNQEGITIIIVTHEAEIAQYARRVIRIRDGKIQSDESKDLISKKESNPSAQSPENETQSSFKNFLHFKTRELTSHITQALRALLANKVRSGLSMLGILIGVASVIAMMALGSGAQESIKQQLSSLGSNVLTLRPGSQRSQGVAMESGAVTRLTLEDAQDIKQSVANISGVAPSVRGRGQAVYGNKNWSTQIVGTTSDYSAIRASNPAVGRFFTDDEGRQRSRIAVIGMTVVKELFQEKNPIGEVMKVNKVNFLVIGVLPEKGSTPFMDQDDMIIIPIQTAMRRLLGKDFVDSIDIQVNDESKMDYAEDAVSQLMIKRHHVRGDPDSSFQIRNMADIQEAVSSTSRILSLLLASIASISLLVGGIGIMNIMLVSVTERTREIGLRKALGATKGSILEQFLIEAVIVSLIGGSFGILLGWSIAGSLSYFAGWMMIVSPTSVIMAVFFSAGTGVAFGLWPAQKASRLHPIEALRYE